MKPESNILTSRRAHVFLDEIKVGLLEQVATDLYTFRYDKAYLAIPDALPLSLALPLQEKPFEHEALLPFFDNLIMEGQLLRYVERSFGLTRHSVVDRFKILLLTGRDTVGAVRVMALDQSGQEIPFNDEAMVTATWQAFPLVPAYRDSCVVCLQKGSSHASCLKKLWDNAKAEPKLLTDPENRNAVFQTPVAGASISGAQRKNVTRLVKGLLKPEIPSTHIIKPDGDYPEMPANEHLTMTIALRAGFNVPPCGLYQVDGVGLVYVIRRFDRDRKGKRFLLEDFAQIMGRHESDKAEASAEALAQVLGQVSSSQKIELAEFFRRLLFNFMIGNGDMHLKNWALIYNPKTKLYKMSPVYDWLNVRASMPTERVESILPLNEKQNDLTGADFERFARNTGVNAKVMEQAFADVAVWGSIVKDFLPRSALSPKRQEVYRRVVIERSKRLALRG